MLIGVSKQIDNLWPLFGDDFGLLPDLELDAVIARYRQGERACVPRIIELVCTEAVGVVQSAEAIQSLDVEALNQQQRRQVERTFDAWWQATLFQQDVEMGSSDFTIEDVLGILAGSPCQMQRWLRVWLEHFDGPGAQLFVDAVRAGSTPSAVWTSKADEWVQYKTWCRAEATVLGLTMVGAAHVSADEISEALEHLV